MKDLAGRMSEADWAEAAQRFADKQAGRGLAEEAEAARAAGEAAAGPSQAALLRDVLAGRARPADLLVRADGSPVPLGTVALVRALLARESRAVSLAARAASSDGPLVRDVGGYAVEVVDEPDALFILVETGGREAPRRLRLLDEQGCLFELSLPEPVEGTVQLGIAASDPSYAALRVALADPTCALFLD